MPIRMTTLLFALLLGTASSTVAAGIVNPVVDGNTVTAGIDIGGFEAELTIEFEQAVGLSADNLGLSAELVSLTDTALISRLGDPLNISLVGGFPILLKIQPPATGGLSFAGIASVELYTHDLLYTVGTPLRLFSAPDGGSFSDITTAMSSGSYRVRGSKGTFSEFLIVADLRSTDNVVDTKFTALSNLLYSFAGSIDAVTFTELENDLSQAQSDWNFGNTVPAIAGIEAFMATVETESGDTIPDVWRSSGGLGNPAGQLRAKAGTLRFSLTLASNNL